MGIYAEYLGNGVGARFVDGKIVLRTDLLDEIYLDEETFNALVSYARRHLGWTAYAPTGPKAAGGADDE